eukprot:1598070-Rhodomonas_salina.2
MAKEVSAIVTTMEAISALPTTVDPLYPQLETAVGCAALRSDVRMCVMCGTELGHSVWSSGMTYLGTRETLVPYCLPRPLSLQHNVQHGDVDMGVCVRQAPVPWDQFGDLSSTKKLRVGFYYADGFLPAIPGVPRP